MPHEYIPAQDTPMPCNRSFRLCHRHILFSSGMIAGEGLIGILLAVFAVVKVNGRSLAEYIDLSGSVNLGQIGALVVLVLVILSILKFTIWNKKVDKE